MKFPNRLEMALGIHLDIVISRKIHSLHAEIVQKDFRIANFFVISETNKLLDNKEIYHILEKFDNSNSNSYFHLDDIKLAHSTLHISREASVLSNKELAEIMSISDIALIGIEDNTFLLAHQIELDPEMIYDENPSYIATKNYSPILSVNMEMDICQN